MILTRNVPPIFFPYYWLLEAQYFDQTIST